MKTKYRVLICCTIHKEVAKCLVKMAENIFKTNREKIQEKQTKQINKNKTKHFFETD